MRLENWSVVEDLSDPYMAPELRARISGKVYGNPKFKDGTVILISRAVGRVGNDILTQSGSRYELGDVDPEYEKIFPDAKNRIFIQFKEKE